MIEGEWLKQKFRSRGIKIRIGDYGSERIKIYYEPVPELLSLNSEVRLLAKRFDCLEYAVCEGEVDAINFHTNCANIDDIVNSFDCGMIKDIGTIFDTSYKAYTIGYRIKGGISIYYYPTICKGNRYGICGITDPKTFKNQITRFLAYISANDECRCWILNQVSYITKFKGICITNSENGYSYKLYYRLTLEGIRKIFKTKCDVESYCSKYGEVVLVSVSILSGQVEAFNLYFLR